MKHGFLLLLWHLHWELRSWNTPENARNLLTHPILYTSGLGAQLGTAPRTQHRAPAVSWGMLSRQSGHVTLLVPHSSPLWIQTAWWSCFLPFSGWQTSHAPSGWWCILSLKSTEDFQLFTVANWFLSQVVTEQFKMQSTTAANFNWISHFSTWPSPWTFWDGPHSQIAAAIWEVNQWKEHFYSLSLSAS